LRGRAGVKFVNVRTPTQPQSEALIDSGENIVVGGANRWAFSTFVNYDFFPSKVFENNHLAEM